MKCPYCGNEMELGLIASPYQIVWTRGEKNNSLIMSEFLKVL